MSSAELHKLARALGVGPDELDFLAAVDAESLRRLREQISDSMFAAHRSQFHKLAALSSSVPGPLAAKITEAAMTPLVSARTAEVLAPDRATDMMKRLSRDYVTEIAVRLDARRAHSLLAALPPEDVAEIAVALAAREEWVVMGAMMSYVSDEALAASVARLSAEQLLRIAYVVDEPERVAAVLDHLDDDGVTDMFAATIEKSLWTEADAVLTALRADQRERVVNLLDAADPSTVAAYDQARSRGELVAI